MNRNLTNMARIMNAYAIANKYNAHGVCIADGDDVTATDLEWWGKCGKLTRADVLGMAKALRDNIEENDPDPSPEASELVEELTALIRAECIEVML